MNSTLLKSTSYIMIIGIVGKCLGFLKQIIIASYYGADINTDIYFLSSGFTGNIAYLLCSTLSITLLTVYVSEKTTKNKEQLNMFLSSVIVLFEVLAIAVVLFFIIFAHPTMKILAASYSDAQISEAVFIFRIILVELLIRVFISINGTVLNAEKKFLPSQFNSIILSGVMMTFVFFLSGRWSIYALVAGELTAYLIQGLFLRARTRRLYQFRCFKIKEQKNTFRLVKLLLPLLVSYGVIEINQVVDKIITTGLGEGVLSALSYGQIIFQAVTTIFVTALTTVFYSYFTESVEKKEPSNTIKLLRENITLMVIVLIPITVWTVLLSEDITRIVYGYGKFNNDAVHNTAMVQIGYCAGLCFLGIRELLIRAHYAYEDTKKPMLISAVSVTINIIGSICLSKVLGVLGVTLASSISEFVSTILLSISIKSHDISLKHAFDFSTIIKIIISGFVCAIVVFYIKQMATNAFLRFGMSVCVCMTIYLAMLYLLKVKEIKYLIAVAKKRIVR